MEEMPFPSMSFEQLFPSLARSQSSQDTYTAELLPGLADADPGKAPTSLRNTTDMDIESENAMTIQKTILPETETADGGPYSVDLRVIEWMQKSKFIVHTPSMPCRRELCNVQKLRSLIHAILQSLMHNGFIRQLEDHQQDWVQWWLMTRFCSRSCTVSYALNLQNILDQLYYKFEEVFEDDLWTDRSSFTATQPLVIHTYYQLDGPHEYDPVEINEHMHVEDRLAFPTCPYSIMLYCFLHDTNNAESHFGWITCDRAAELTGAKHSNAM